MQTTILRSNGNELRTALDEPLRLAIPKGRMHAGVVDLLAAAGIRVEADERGYRPRVSLERVEAKILKPQNIVEMLELGRRDVGFAGADWVAELDANLVELLDTKLAPVRIVAAAPSESALSRDRVVVASEYERLTRRWMSERGLSNATFVRSYGATEVFPPEDADCIVDNTATGSTLRANGLAIIDELMVSSTRLYANPRALERKRKTIEDLTLVLRAVLEARQRVMVEVNVPAEALDRVVAALPCMRQPTIARLADDSGFAVKAAVPREALPRLIPRLKARGGGDIVVSNLAQIVV